jgi:putative transposase
MLGYKTTWNGGRLILADRWFASSKTCSECGWRKRSLTLKERLFICEACGLVLDRDTNAARNLFDLAASGAESINACGATVRPGHSGQVPVKQEPGISAEGQTGTASRHERRQHERSRALTRNGLPITWDRPSEGSSRR